MENKITKLNIKEANLNDAGFLLKIHNTSVAGGYFHSKNLVKYSEHIKWFKSKLNSKNSQIYIGKKNRIRFGYVRFDKVENNIFEVSLGNLPIFYSKGLGSKMLGYSIQKFIKNFSPKKITSVIKRSNIRSQKSFLKNGFVKTNFNIKKHKTIKKINKNKENYFELKIKQK